MDMLREVVNLAKTSISLRTIAWIKTRIRLMRLTLMMVTMAMKITEGPLALYV